MTMDNKKWTILGLVLTFCVILGIAIVGLIPHERSDIPALQGGFDSLTLDSDFPTSPIVMPIYKVKSIEKINVGNEKLAYTVKKSTPSAMEAPVIAEKALEKYGGLPKEAQLIDATPRYINKFNLTTNAVEEKYPISTQVRYRQTLSGMPVIGAGIDIDLGENNEIIDIMKIWPVYERIGEVKVISPQEGFEKLKSHETTEKVQGNIPEGTKITDIKLGYKLYRAGPEEKESHITPVWIYYASMPPAYGSMPFVVDATAT
ncbi:MAG: two-component system regulatory protein YycI [Methanoregula sp.]|jgi:hypothetical protein|nr:two-component system regulatory protein YycI [Methanoregula sp.]